MNSQRRTPGELINGTPDPAAHSYDLTVPVLVLIVVAVALVGGVLVGYLLGDRRRSPLVAVPEPPISPAPALSATVIDALGTGVVVLDRDERVRLVNPAAQGMGILNGDRLDVSDLIDLTRAVIREARPAQAEIRLPAGRLGREPIAVAAAAVPLRDQAAAGARRFGGPATRRRHRSAPARGGAPGFRRECVA